MLISSICYSIQQYNLGEYRTGPKWREERTRLGKQVTPANVYGYVPGFNKATDRLVRNIREMRESDGYVKDFEELVMCWSLEGN